MNCFSKRSRRLNRQRRGSAVVECALVSPIIVLLVLGSLDVGQFINVSQMVDNASREGARLASHDVDMTVEDIENKVLNYLGDCYPALSSEAISQATVISVSGGNDVTPLTETTGIQSGDKISVEVTFQYETVRWISGFLNLNGRTISSKAVMRRE